MGDLEIYEAIFSLFSNNIKNGVNELSTLNVMTLDPVVTSASLTENEVFGPEKLTQRISTDRVRSF